MSKTRAVISLVLAAAVLAVAALGALLLLRAARKPPERPVSVTVPILQAPPIAPLLDHRVEIVGFGSARARARVEIAPLVSGQVVWKAPGLLTGLRVREGDVLFRIDANDFRLAREAAAAQLEMHEAQLARLEQEARNLRESEAIERERLQLAQEQLADIRELQTRGAAGRSDVDTARDKVLAQRRQLQMILDEMALVEPRRRELQASIAADGTRLQQAELDLGRAEVPSPVTGRILRSEVDLGERVQAGTAYVELYATDVMEVPVSIAAADLRWLDPDSVQRCRMGAPLPPSPPPDALVQWTAAANGPPATWPGCVGRIEAGLEAETRTAMVVIYVNNPPPDSDAPLLDLNMFCRVRIQGRRVERAFLLPRSAVLPEQQVYVVEDGRLQTRDVDVARYTGETAMILPGGGLEAGDRVVLQYLPKPIPGMRVRVEDEESTTTQPARP